MGSIQLGASGKLIGAIVISLGLMVLMATHTLDAGQGMPPITLVVGYVIGNGVASRSGVGVQSIIEPKGTGDAPGSASG
jgi:hypothetical protein